MTENSEIEQTWNKIVRDSAKVGFREGAADANEVTYQNQFDLGYAKGFEYGFIIGQQMSNLRNPTEAGVNIHNKIKEQCDICKNPSLL